MATPNLPPQETARQTLLRLIEAANRGGPVKQSMLQDFILSLQGVDLGRRAPGKDKGFRSSAVRDYLKKQGVSGEEANRIIKSFLPGTLPQGMELDRPLIVDMGQRADDLGDPFRQQRGSLVENPVKTLKGTGQNPRLFPYDVFPTGSEARLQQAQALSELEDLGERPRQAKAKGYTTIAKGKKAPKANKKFIDATLRAVLDVAEDKKISKADRAILMDMVIAKGGTRYKENVKRFRNRDAFLVDEALQITGTSSSTFGLTEKTNKLPGSEDLRLTKLFKKLNPGKDPLEAYQKTHFLKRVLDMGGKPIKGMPQGKGIVDPETVKPPSPGQGDPDSPLMERRSPRYRAGRMPEGGKGPRLSGESAQIFDEAARPYTEVFDQPMEINRSLRREVEDIARKENWSPRKREQIINDPDGFKKYVQSTMVSKKNPQLMTLLPGIASKNREVRAEAKAILEEALEVEIRYGDVSMRPSNIDYDKAVAGDAAEIRKAEGVDPKKYQVKGTGEGALRMFPQEAPASRPSKTVLPMVGVQKGTQMKGNMVNALASLLSARNVQRGRDSAKRGKAPGRFPKGKDVAPEIAQAIRILRRLGMTGDIDIPGIGEGREGIAREIQKQPQFQKMKSPTAAAKVLKSGAVKITPSILAMLAPLLLAGVAGSIGDNDV